MTTPCTRQWRHHDSQDRSAQRIPSCSLLPGATAARSVAARVQRWPSLQVLPQFDRYQKGLEGFKLYAMTESMPRPSGLVPTILWVRGAGRRDVLFNLQIVTEQTAVLGVNGHICELQLILRSFVEVKVL